MVHEPEDPDFDDVQADETEHGIEHDASVRFASAAGVREDGAHLAQAFEVRECGRQDCRERGRHNDAIHTPLIVESRCFHSDRLSLAAATALI